ncbi:MAG: hypothetical protein ACRD1K_20120 [Acidimicrobiales bacterium]
MPEPARVIVVAGLAEASERHPVVVALPTATYAVRDGSVDVVRDRDKTTCAAEGRTWLSRTASGVVAAQVVLSRALIGTHRLLSADIAFKNLGLFVATRCEDQGLRRLCRSG